LLTSTNPESGKLTYVYDVNSNVQTKTDARNVATTYSYDVLDRILGKTYNDGFTLPAVYSYDTSTVSGATNVIGRMAQESTIYGGTYVVSQRSFGYDSMGRVLLDQQCFGNSCTGTLAPPYTPSYTYDLAGGMTTATFGLPSSVTAGLGATVGSSGSLIQLSYQYDTAHRLSSVTSNIAESTAYPSILFETSSVDAVPYGPMGLMNASLGVNGAATLVDVGRTYDNRGRTLSEADTAKSESSGALAMGQIAIYGTEQSEPVAAVPGTPGTALIQIANGQPYQGSGSFSVTVNGQTTTAYVSGSISPASVATAVVTSIASSSLPVTASQGGPNVYLTAKTSGVSTNYSMSVNPQVSFAVTAPSALSGGTNGTPAGTAYDTGTVSAVINGKSSSYTYGQSSTDASIASGLMAAINANESGIVTASISNGAIELTSVTGVNLPVTTSATDTAYGFASPSFSTGYLVQLGYGYSIPPVGGYDAAGNIKNVADAVTGTWAYTYDPLNRLATGTPSSGSYNGQHGCWAYDGFGNRTAAIYQTSTCPTSETGLTPNSTYNTNNYVTGTNVNSATNGFTYDAAGNVLNDNLNQYFYDAEGRVCAVSSRLGGITAYLYGADGARVAKGTMPNFNCSFVAGTGSTLTNVYILGLNGEQVSELTFSGSTYTWAHSNVFAGGKLLATYNSTGTYFSLNDWLGTKRAEVGTAPYGCGSFTFSLAFGDGQSTAGNCPADATEQHFTGKERDAESGLDYFGARYYASSMGRWMSPDWADKPEAVPYSQLDNPQSLNLYGYVNNNPLSKADPDGHCPFCPAIEEALQYVADSPAGEAVANQADKVVSAIGVAGVAVGGFVATHGQEIIDANASYYANGGSGNTAGAPLSLMKNGPAAAPAEGEKTPTGPKAATAPGVTAGGQATNEHGQKLGPSGKPQANNVNSNTREGAKNAGNKGSGTVEHPNPKEGDPHFHTARGDGTKVQDSTHYNYPK
jgi:RHS repeat-associated protein